MVSVGERFWGGPEDVAFYHYMITIELVFLSHFILCKVLVVTFPCCVDGLMTRKYSTPETFKNLSLSLTWIMLGNRLVRQELELFVVISSARLILILLHTWLITLNIWFVCDSCDIANRVAVPWYKVPCCNIFSWFCTVCIRCCWSACRASLRPVRLWIVCVLSNWSKTKHN